MYHGQYTSGIFTTKNGKWMNFEKTNNNKFIFMLANANAKNRENRKG
jgi:hypothetical protein